MVLTCCAFECNEKFVAGSPITFHSFPKDDDRRKQWSIQLGRENFNITDYTKICSKHFTLESFDEEKLGGTWLKKDAVPTLFDFPSHMSKKESRRKKSSLENVQEVPTPLANSPAKNELADAEKELVVRCLTPYQELIAKGRQLGLNICSMGISNHSTSLPKGNSTEPGTFVSAVCQMQNMSSQNQINNKNRLFNASSEIPHQNIIPGCQQSTTPPSVQDVYPSLEYAASLENHVKPAIKTVLPLSIQKVDNAIKNYIDQTTSKHTTEESLDTITKSHNLNKFVDVASIDNIVDVTNMDVANGIDGKSSAMLYNNMDVSTNFGMNTISSAVSDKAFTSSTPSDNLFCHSNHDGASPVFFADREFVIPWHKLPKTLLESLDKKEKLSIFQKRSLIRIVCYEFNQWKPNSSNYCKDMRKIAKRMIQKYPASLSDACLEQANGKYSSLLLAKDLRSRMGSLKKKKKKQKWKNHGRRVKKQPAIPSKGIFKWAVNFKIPWEKMPQNLRECLILKEGLTPYLRQEMVRVISSKIQNIEKNPNKESLEFISNKICKMYPKSLCDMCGDVDSRHGFLGRELLLEIQRINNASKSFIDQETLKLTTVESLDTITGSHKVNEFVDVASIDNIVDVANMDVATCIDEKSADVFCNNTLEKDVKPAVKTPLPLPLSEDYTKASEIPWERLPKSVRNCQSKNPGMTVIKTVCKKIFQKTRQPQQNELEMIAKKMFKRWGLLGNASLGKHGEEYKQLTKRLNNRIEWLRWKATKKFDVPCPSNRKVAPPFKSADWEFIIPWYKLDKTLLDSLNKAEKLSIFQTHALFHFICFEFIQCEPNVPPNQPSNVSEKMSEIIKQMVQKYPASLSNIHLGKTSTACVTQILTNIVLKCTEILKAKTVKSSKPVVEPAVRDWAINFRIPWKKMPRELLERIKKKEELISPNGDFNIPWDKLDKSLLESLEKKKKLSIPQIKTFVRIMHCELNLWTTKALAPKMRKIAMQMSRKYPFSLYDCCLWRSGGKKSSFFLAYLLLNGYEEETASGPKQKKVKKQVAVPPKVDSGVEDWAIKFTISLEKMPCALLEVLKNKKRLTPTLRQKLVRVISDDILKIKKYPSKECVDFIGLKVYKMYPNSLSDPFSMHKFFAHQLLTRIRKSSKHCADQNTSKDATPESLGAVKEPHNMNEFGDVDIKDNIVDVDTKDNIMGVPTDNSYTQNRIVIADYGSISMYFDSGNNISAFNCLNQVEHFIKKEVLEPDA